MKCNIVELGGTKNGFFTRNHFVDISQIKNNLKLFDGDIYSTVYRYDSKDQNTANFIAPLYLDLDIDDIEHNFNKIKQDFCALIGIHAGLRICMCAFLRLLRIFHRTKHSRLSD